MDARRLTSFVASAIVLGTVGYFLVVDWKPAPPTPAPSASTSASAPPPAARP